jgi:hypothetical protein
MRWTHAHLRLPPPPLGWRVCPHAQQPRTPLVRWREAALSLSLSPSLVQDVLLLYVGVASDAPPSWTPPGGAPPLSSAQRDTLLAVCPSDVRAALAAAFTAVAGQATAPFIDAVELAAERVCYASRPLHCPVSWCE